MPRLRFLLTFAPLLLVVNSRVLYYADKDDMTSAMTGKYVDAERRTAADSLSALNIAKLEWTNANTK